MKTLKGYNNFILESKDSIMMEIESLFFLPFDERKMLEVELKKLGYATESVNEGFIQNIKDKLHKWLTDRALKYLINNKARLLPKMLEGLTVLDPTDLSNIDKIEAMYLGGGIDFAIDEGAGWRVNVEEFFGIDHVVTGEDVYKLGEDGKIAVRNARRDQNDVVKKAEKSKEITEDELKKFTEEVQKVTDKFIKDIDEIISLKEKELLTV